MPTRIIALELGTTNSAVGYRDFDGGKPITDEEIVSVGLYNALPTCIVEADKNPHISRDLFGREALDMAMRNSRTVFTPNFKVDLVDPKTKGAHLEALRLATKMFTWMHGLYRERANLKTSDAPDGYDLRTYVTHPVRATLEQVAALRKAASDAGFQNVAVVSEADTVVRCALTKENNPLRTQVRSDALKLLIIGMGGGMTNIRLYSYTRRDCLEEGRRMRLS